MKGPFMNNFGLCIEEHRIGNQFCIEVCAQISHVLELFGRLGQLRAVHLLYFIFDIQQLLFGDYSLANSCLLATGRKDKEQPSRKRKKLLTC